MCDSSGICPFGISNPEFLIYDFTEGSMLGGNSWIGTQSPDKGTGPDFTIA